MTSPFANAFGPNDAEQASAIAHAPSASYLRVTSDLAAEAPVEYRKFGIVGDGKSFDHGGIRALLDALDNYGTVHLGGNPAMLLGETVTLSDRAGLTLTTDREPNI